MTTEYLTEDRNPHIARRAAGAGGLFTVVAALLLAACSSSSSDGGPTAPPPSPPPPPPPTNTAPTAAAGPDMTVSTSIGVRLDGSGSSDTDGDALTYAWSFASVPSGSAATFDDESSAQPAFTPDLAGDYRIELVVSDGTVTSGTDEIVVTAADNTATQSVGPGGGQVVSSDGLVTLDVPAGALMADTDISVTWVPEDQYSSYLGPEFDGLENIGPVYDLSPDGLTFGTPAIVTAVTSANPVLDATTLGGEFVLLVTSDGDEAQLLGDQVLAIDADSAGVTATGTLDHFSPVAIFGAGARYVEWRISGIPDSLEPGEMADVSYTVTSTQVDIDRAQVEIFEADDAFNPEALGQFSLLRQGDNEFADNIRYECRAPGVGRVRSTLFVEPSMEQGPDVPGLFNDARFGLEARASKVVVCEFDADPAGPSLPAGVFPAPAGLTVLETVQTGILLSDMSIDGAVSGATDPMVLLAGAEGTVLFNPISGEVVRDSTDPNRIDPLFGAVLASTTLPGGAVAGMIYEFGPGQLGANRRCDYDDSAQDFSTFCEGRNGTGYDATPVGGSHSTREVAYVTVFEIGSIRTNSVTGGYEYSELPVSFSDFFGSPFSALRTVEDGPMLVVTNDAPNFSTLSQVDTTGLVTLHETFFGEDLRKIRCVRSLCGMTVYDDGNGNGGLRLAIWDGANAPTLINSTIPVGDGPVGVAALDLGNGNALFGTTGFNDNTVTLTQSTLSGDLVSNHTAPAPDGCESPAHLDWYVPDGADPSQAQLVGTCFGSNQYFVVDIVEDPNLGFIFTDPTATP